MKDHIDHITGE